jgi:glycerol-3-phosphate acyltransferase PlsY
MWFASLLFIVGAYLWGAIPNAYLVARWKRGIDLREIGSRNVGGSNLRVPVGTWATVTVGLIDIAKGALPVWLGQRAGLGDTAPVMAGLAAVAGHNWSPWLRFQGGRGMATSMGVLLVRFPTGLAWILGALAVGALTSQVAFLHAMGVATVPLLSIVLGEPAVVVSTGVALVLLMVIKRLEANEGSRAFQSDRHTVLLNRLFHDRDVR